MPQGLYKKIMYGLFHYVVLENLIPIVEKKCGSLYRTLPYFRQKHCHRKLHKIVFKFQQHFYFGKIRKEDNVGYANLFTSIFSSIKK